MSAPDSPCHRRAGTCHNAPQGARHDRHDTPSCLPQRHLSEELMKRAAMLNVIKASLVGSALMLLASCTGYLTNYQTPCVQGHVCECVQYTTVYRSWLDCRDYGRVKSRSR